MICKEECPRGRKDCKPLSNLSTEDGKDFVCCGENNGTTRELNQDKFTLCFVNDETDEISHNDEYDLKSLLSVISEALLIDEINKLR